MLRFTIALLLAAGVVSAQDSPLVALAKRSNRKASKTPVITNQTVGQRSGRISTVDGAVPPLTTGTTAAAPATAASPAPVTQPARPATPAAPAPAMASSMVAPADPKAASVRNIDPYSTARSVEPSSSARTVAPVSGAQNINPTSTVQTVQPTSTVRTVAPQSTAKSQ